MRDYAPDAFSARQVLRFWSHVASRADGCWEWTGARGRAGYGYFSIKDRRFFAHRLAFALVNGPIPPGLFVCHRCDNPPCCRPDHLFLGTTRDNVVDAMRKGRRRSVSGRDVPSDGPPNPSGRAAATNTHISFVLHRDLRAWIAEEARSYDCTGSDIVRAALEHYCCQPPEVRQGIIAASSEDDAPGR